MKTLDPPRVRFFCDLVELLSLLFPLTSVSFQDIASYVYKKRQPLCFWLGPWYPILPFSSAVHSAKKTETAYSCGIRMTSPWMRCRLCETKTQCQWMRRGGPGRRWQTSKFILQRKGASQLSQMASRGIGPIVGNFFTCSIKAKFFIFMWNFLIFQGWQVFRFFKYQAGWQHICGPGLSARMPVLNILSYMLSFFFSFYHLTSCLLLIQCSVLSSATVHGHYPLQTHHNPIKLWGVKDESYSLTADIRNLPRARTPFQKNVLIKKKKLAAHKCFLFFKRNWRRHRYL